MTVLTNSVSMPLRAPSVRDSRLLRDVLLGLAVAVSLSLAATGARTRALDGASGRPAALQGFETAVPAAGATVLEAGGTRWSLEDPWLP